MDRGDVFFSCPVIRLSKFELNFHDLNSNWNIWWEKHWEISILSEGLMTDFMNKSTEVIDCKVES